MDRWTKKESKDREKKNNHHKLYTQPHEPEMFFTSHLDVSGTSSPPGMKTKGTSSHLVLNRKKSSTKKREHGAKDVFGSDDDIFIKPKAAKAHKSSSSRCSRSPQIQSSLKTSKLRKSLSHVSPRHRTLSGFLPGSAEKKRRHTLSMTTVDMKRIQNAIGHNQRRKKEKKNKDVKAKTDGGPVKMSHQKPGETDIVDGARSQIDKFKCGREKYRNSKKHEHHKGNKVMTSKQEHSGDFLHPSNNKLSGKHEGQPYLDLPICEEMSNPSQELFTDIESGNETDTQAVVQRTVSRFLSSQEAHNDFKKARSPVVQTSSLFADLNNQDSEVSESSEDEANETVLEKEIRSFFERKKQDSSSQSEVTLASNVARNCVHHQGTEGGMSDESDVITAGQKVQSTESQIIYAEQMMESQTESEVINAGHNLPSDESEVITAGQKMQIQTEHDDDDDDAMDEDTLQSTSDSASSLGDGQRLSDNTSNKNIQGMRENQTVLKQNDRQRNGHEDLVSREENGLRTSQMHRSQTSLDVESSDHSDLNIGELIDASPIPFHSTPAEPTSHLESTTKQDVPNAVSISLTEVKKDKKMFELYCHKDNTTLILKALESCGNIDSRTLASAGVDDGRLHIEVIRGKVFEEAVDRTRTVTSPDLFEDNLDGIDGGMEIEEAEPVTEPPARQKSPKRKDGEKYESKKPKKKKKTKRKKVAGIPGNTTAASRVKVIAGPIKGDARKENEYRWKQEMKEQSKSPWGQTTVEPSLESDLSLLRSLKAVAKAALNQPKTQQDRDAELGEDDPDLGTFVNLVSFPDVFMTKKKDWPSFRRVPPSEIQVLNGF